MEKKPEDLKISISDTAETNDSLSENKNSQGRNLSDQEIMVYLERYVSPHNTKARTVTEEDIPYVLEEARVLMTLCQLPRGIYKPTSLAHSQIEDKKPLRFFVIPHLKYVIINPLILNHTNFVCDGPQGCMAYPTEPFKQRVPHFHKVDVIFQLPVEKDNKIVLSLQPQQTLTGSLSKIFQHEIAHLNGHNIYDDDYSAHVAVGNHELGPFLHGVGYPCPDTVKEG